ncbi:Hypothetical predicted protein [Mytilus galloprovincialis]|uniref:Uncharacterized protein n=1 Tax=Mytilus galloprovincialis TaxID=29158 RepID=A0A8B6D3U9_MYTGA|nr:Hypothetical predicted protein [Mytilus galloprovincialis]
MKYNTGVDQKKHGCSNDGGRSALCKFPCEWIGKTFIWEDTQVPPNPNGYGTITYSKCNHSVAVLTVNVNTVDLVCLEIKGPYILLKWTIQEGSFLDCLTVKIISPDVFTFIARGAVETGGFCNACFEANENNAISVVARAYGATDDADVLTCTAPPPKCHGKRRKHCKGLTRLKQCRRPGYWYSGKPSHYKYRTAKPCKKWN